jgi:hypothetical protein
MSELHHKKDKFEVYMDEFFEMCRDMYRERGEQYNQGGVHIREYQVFGIRSPFHAIWGKVNRIKARLLACPSLEAFQETDLGKPGYSNDIIDLAVYAAIMFAENRCRLDDILGPIKFLENVEESNEQCQPAGGYPTVDDVTPTGSDVERMVLDARSGPSDHEFCSPHVGACPACTAHAEGARHDPRVCFACMGDLKGSAKFPRATGKDA